MPGRGCGARPSPLSGQAEMFLQHHCRRMVSHRRFECSGCPEGQDGGRSGLAGNAKKGWEVARFHARPVSVSRWLKGVAPFSFLLGRAWGAALNFAGYETHPLRILHAGPRAASKGLQLPGDGGRPVTPSAMPHDTGPHHHERTVRPRPRIGGNATECTAGVRGVDKFVVCQEGPVLSPAVMPDRVARGAIARSGIQISVHRRCCRFLCCLDFGNGARCASADVLVPRSACSNAALVWGDSSGCGAVLEHLRPSFQTVCS